MQETQMSGLPTIVFTVPEAAAVMKCSPRRIYELLAKGIIRRANQFGARTVVLAKSVYDALEAGTMPEEPKPKRVRPTQHKVDWDALLKETRKGVTR